MKIFLSFLSILLSSICFAQDSIPAEKVEAPLIVSKLYLGKSFEFEDIEVRFIELIEDSRCPKNVNCIWAGEVTILVAIFKNGEKMENKRLTLSPTNTLKNFLGNIFSSEAIHISGLNVLPYPEAGVKPEMNDYYIQLDIRN